MNSLLVSSGQQEPFIFFFLIFIFKDFLFPFSPQSPPVHRRVFFFLVVGPSSCGMWDTVSAWPDERCHVRAQDPNQGNSGPLRRSVRT